MLDETKKLTIGFILLCLESNIKAFFRYKNIIVFHHMCIFSDVSFLFNWPYFVLPDALQHTCCLDYPIAVCFVL